jgi:hypothetical protein
MASCPNCQKQIEINEEHFGTLFRCSHCKSEFFVDFSGVPENSKEPLQNEIEPSSAPLAEVKPEAEIKSTISEVPESQNFGMDFMNPSESQSENQLPPATFSENNYLNQHEPGATNYLDNNFLSTNQEQQAQENQTQADGDGGAESFYNQVEQGIGPAQTFNPSVDSVTEKPMGNMFNDVVEFGNDVQNHNGVLTFDITIDEIDLPEQKKMLIEFLEDSRLGLDIEEIKTKLKYGKIEIQNFPAPKAIVLIQRIQGLSLKVYWRQNVSTQ